MNKARNSSLKAQREIQWCVSYQAESRGGHVSVKEHSLVIEHKQQQTSLFFLISLTVLLHVKIWMFFLDFHLF